MNLERQVKLAMDTALQNEKDQEEEARMREGLASYGYDESALEGINLPGLRALFRCESGRAHPQANDRRLALDAKGDDLSVRYGVARPRRL